MCHLSCVSMPSRLAASVCCQPPPPTSHHTPPASAPSSPDPRTTINCAAITLLLVYYTLLSTRCNEGFLCSCCVSVSSTGYRKHGSPSFLRFCGTPCASQFCGSSTGWGRWPLLLNGARQPQLLVHGCVPRSVSFDA